MAHNPLFELRNYGQSVWCDNIARGLIKNGEFQKLINDFAVVGVTSNPTIFEKAIGHTPDYDDQLRELVQQGKDAEEIFWTMAIQDVGDVADIFRPVYDSTNGLDGYISLEVSPALANNTEQTIADARRFYQTLNRPNIMIKVPATPAGIPAIEQLISEGINVNVTLIFSIESYEAVANAYINGLEKLAASGTKPLSEVASVASFFVSRVDVLVDKLLGEKINQTEDEGKKAELESLLGKIAIANSKLAYEKFGEIFNGERFQKLREQGAKVQRVLWASTSTKNPKYRDILYAEELVGPDTVDTMPPATIEAFADHGVVKQTLNGDYAQAHEEIQKLEANGILVKDVTQELLDNGVKLFADAFTQLLDGVEQKRQKIEAEVKGQQGQNNGDQNQGAQPGAAEQDYSTPTAAQEAATSGTGLGKFEAVVQAAISKLDEEKAASRVWQQDTVFWKSDPDVQKKIANRLDWLNVAHSLLSQVNDLTKLAEDVKSEGFKKVVLLGMGGSSLAPEVLRRTFGVVEGFPELTVVDTTDPSFILQVAESHDPATTLFIVSSKSGSTTEPNMFMAYFYDKVKQVKGDNAGENFIAITDPGSSLEKHAKDNNFRDIFLNPEGIGGRYSALSYFGIVPAALAGYDVAKLLQRAVAMADACGPNVNGNENPGVVLGAAMGSLANTGVDKVTIIVPEAISSYGLWAEQLLAESTGKEGKGLVPVASETLGTPEDYSDDRFFVALHLANQANSDTEQKLQALQTAGHPVMKLQLNDIYDIASEFFRWEFAVAIAGQVLGINPFDEPNVQESKDNTKRLLGEYQSNGKLPETDPVAREDGLSLYGQVSGAAADASAGGSITDYLSNFLREVKPGTDYVAILAYITPSEAHSEALEAIRLKIRDSLKVATTVGYGPRFLHSTGQLHKGGANTGVFIEITADDPQDAPIAGEPYGFSILKQAQALGDFQSLQSHGRRAITIHLQDLDAGLSKLNELVGQALGSKVS